MKNQNPMNTMISYQRISALAAVLLIGGCGGGETQVSYPSGTERGPCRADGTCDSGLTCLSNVCVVWSPSNGQPNGMPNNASTPDAGTGDDTGTGVPDLNSLDLGEADTAPAAPAMLTATAGANVAIDVAWIDNSDDEGGFILERRDDVTTPDFEQLALVDADVTSYADTGLIKGIEYTYRVKAVNNAGSSDYSNEGALRTPAPTLQADIVPIFEASCGSGNTGCHARNQYAATADRDCRGWLALENAPIGAFVYDENGNNMQATGCQDRDLLYRLTQIRAWQCSEGAFVAGDADYVVPGDPENSYLWQKMEGTRLCDVGDQPSERMPQTGMMDAAERLLIRQWIATGAQP